MAARQMAADQKESKKKSTFLNWLFSRVFFVWYRFVQHNSAGILRNHHLWYWFFKADPPVSIWEGFDRLPWQFLRKWALSVFYTLLGKVEFVSKKCWFRMFLKNSKKILNRLGAWKIEVVLENQYRRWGFHPNPAKLFLRNRKKSKKMTK